MVEVLNPLAAQPSRVFERVPGAVEIHEVRPRETAVVRVTVDPASLPHAIQEALAKVERATGEAAVGLAGPPFVRYFSWGPERLEAEIGFPVLRPAPAMDDVRPATLPGGRVASVIHVGPYETIATTYAALEAWLRSQGHGSLGAMWEVYWSDPEAEPDPSTWRTEIIVPLA
jgi:effector-binding domain-containing protein